MLKAETAIRSLLLANATIAAGIGTRMYPEAAPKGAAFPLAVISRETADPHHNMTGASGLRPYEVTVAFYGWNGTALANLAVVAGTVIDGHKGTVTVGGESVEIDAAFLMDERESQLEVTNADGSDQPLFASELLFRVFRREVEA